MPTAVQSRVWAQNLLLWKRHLPLSVHPLLRVGWSERRASVTTRLGRVRRPGKVTADCPVTLRLLPSDSPRGPTVCRRGVYTGHAPRQPELEPGVPRCTTVAGTARPSVL